MNGIRILAREIPLEPLSAPLPDGYYALVCFRGNSQVVSGFQVINPFPWWASVVHFSGGLCDDRYSGSNVAEVLSRDNLKEVLVIEMSLAHRRELDEMLALKNIELIDV